MTDVFRVVDTAASFAPDDVRGYVVDGVPVAVGRSGERYFALPRQCLHAGGDLASGIVARGHIVCPQHGWRFSVTTGQHDSMAAACLRTFAVRVEDGMVAVCVTLPAIASAAPAR